jgi:ferritin-like metal-binding protein YciE
MEPLLNLRDLLQHEIEDLYSAEEQIIEALPKMVEKASNRQLKEALNQHLKITKGQKTRLDKVQQLLKKEKEPENEKQKGFLERMFGGGTKCKGTEGLIKEGEKMMKEDMDVSVMDAAIIASAQKIEHYEISGYGTARAYAIQLGLSEVAGLLETTLNEEYKSDDMLTALALSKVNVEAEIGSGDSNDRNKGGSNTRKPAHASIKKAPQKATKKAATAPKKSPAKKAATKKG